MSPQIVYKRRAHPAMISELVRRRLQPTSFYFVAFGYSLINVENSNHDESIASIRVAQ
jgi:CRP-like cAMP-binding protein